MVDFLGQVDGNFGIRLELSEFWMDTEMCRGLKVSQ